MEGQQTLVGREKGGGRWTGAGSCLSCSVREHGAADPPGLLAAAVLLQHGDEGQVHAAGPARQVRMGHRVGKEAGCGVQGGCVEGETPACVGPTYPPPSRASERGLQISKG